MKDGVNWYTYAGNNPLRFVDPSGLEYIAGFDVTGTGPGERMEYEGTPETKNAPPLENRTYLNYLTKSGKLDVFDYFYENSAARDKAIAEIQRNNLAYIPAIPYHKTLYNPFGMGFIKGSNFIQFAEDRRINPDNYYLIWTSLNKGNAQVKDYIKFKAGTKFELFNQSITIDEIWNFAMNHRQEFVGKNAQGIQNNPWLTLCNYAFGYVAEQYGGKNLQTPDNGRNQYSIGKIIKNMNTNIYDSEKNNLIYVETTYDIANKYAGKGGYAAALNEAPDVWHGVTMLGPDKNKIPQVFNAGMMSWGAGQMNLGSAFGIPNIYERYISADMRYFVLIYNPKRK